MLSHESQLGPAKLCQWKTRNKTRLQLTPDVDAEGFESEIMAWREPQNGFVFPKKSPQKGTWSKDVQSVPKKTSL